MRKNKYRQSPNFAHNSFLKTGRNSSNRLTCYRGADKSLARPGRKQATATEDVDVHIFFYNHNRRNISTIYIYITRLASNEIFSSSNKIHREVGRAKDLSAPRYNGGTFPIA